MDRELAVLVRAGHAHYPKDLNHLQYGAAVWRSESEIFDVTLFELGIKHVDRRSGRATEITLSDIKRIDSSLNAQVISEASRTNNMNSFLPMRFATSDKEIELDIPLLIYSGLLIAISARTKRTATK